MTGNHRDGLARASVVVLGVCVVAVVGLLLPGVQRVRFEQRQTGCTNNLRQIGLAVANYEIAKKKYPPAALPPADLPPERRMGWLMALMPYLESESPYRSEGEWDSERNRSAAVHFHILVCPMATDATTTLDTSYVGVTGVGPDAAVLPPDHPRAGVFGYDRKTASHAMLDGQSHTLLAVEAVGGLWLRSGPPTLRAVDPAERPYTGPGRPFGGRHDPYLPVLLADGAVRAIGPNVAPEVLEALATIAGKEPLPADW